MVLGISGGIGSGKSFVAECFLSLDNTVYYHADKEAKGLMNTSEEIRQEVIAQFGDESYINKELNRPFIAGIVFENPEKLKILNSIVHPRVKQHFADFIKNQSDSTIIIYENAILFEAKSDIACDIILTVTAPIETRIQRVIQRDNVSREEVEKRMKRKSGLNIKKECI